MSYLWEEPVHCSNKPYAGHKPRKLREVHGPPEHLYHQSGVRGLKQSSTDPPPGSWTYDWTRGPASTTTGLAGADRGQTTPTTAALRNRGAPLLRSVCVGVVPSLRLRSGRSHTVTSAPSPLRPPRSSKADPLWETTSLPALGHRGASTPVHSSPTSEKTQ